MDVEDFERALQRAWDGATSTDSRWTPSNPALGQCLPTALVIWSLWGGDLRRCLVRSPGGRIDTHWFNAVSSGQLLDLTASQFEDAAAWSRSERRAAAPMLYDEDVLGRVQRLRERLSAGGVEVPDLSPAEDSGGDGRAGRRLVSISGRDGLDDETRRRHRR